MHVTKYLFLFFVTKITYFLATTMRFSRLKSNQFNWFPIFASQLFFRSTPLSTNGEERCESETVDLGRCYFPCALYLRPGRSRTGSPRSDPDTPPGCVPDTLCVGTVLCLGYILTMPTKRPTGLCLKRITLNCLLNLKQRPTETYIIVK